MNSGHRLFGCFAATLILSVWAGLPSFGQDMPYFLVNPGNEHVWGHDWPTGSNVTVTVGNPGELIGTVTVNEWGDWHLHYDEHQRDLMAGDLITVSDGTTEIAHTVTSLTLTNIDLDADTLAGTAEPGSWVAVEILGGQAHQSVQADTEGNWSAIFDFDIRMGMWGGVSQAGDTSVPYGSTYVEWNVLLPLFRVNPANEHVWGHDWPAGSNVTVTVGNPGELIGTVTVNEWGDWHLHYDEHQRDFMAGDLITVSDGTTEIAHTVTALTVMGIDLDSDTVSGTAEPESWVSVSMHNMDMEGLWVQADINGDWSGTFNFDLRAGMSGGASQEDDTSAPFGSTYIEWETLLPHFRVNPADADDPWALGDNGVWGHDWPVGNVVTVFVGAVQIGTAVVDDENDWDLWDAGFDFQPGDVVTVTDGETTIAHTVRGLAITDIDLDTDTISGVAEPGSWVAVEIWYPADEHYWVQADEQGNWSATFTYDIQEGTDGGVYQDDDTSAPYGSTFIEWRVDQPHFNVNPLVRQISGQQWPSRAAVHLVVGDPDDPDLSAGKETDEGGNFVFHDLPLMLTAGTRVEITCGDKVKTHIIHALGVPDIDAENDTINGTAGPGAWVDVHFYGFGIVRSVQADVNGDWLADLSVADGDENTFDIQEGTAGDVSVRDEDGDATVSSFRHSTMAPELFALWIEVREGPGPGSEFLFEFGLEGGGIHAARFRSPLETWYDLHTDWWREEWDFEYDEASFAALDARFPAGDYLVEITRADGVTTTVLHIAESLEMPNAIPDVIYPLHEAANIPWPDILLQWSPVAAPNFNFVYIEVEDDDPASEEALFETMAEGSGLVEYPVSGLMTGKMYEAGVGFVNIQSGYTTDDVAYEVVRARVVETFFTVGSTSDPFLLDRVAWYGTHGIQRGIGESWAEVDGRDPFGKRMTLEQEFVADTNPNESNSVFKVLAVHAGPPVTVVFEPGSTNRVYTLEYTGDVKGGIWQTVPGAEAQPGAGGVDSLPNSGTTSDGAAFRVRVNLP